MIVYLLHYIITGETWQDKVWKFGRESIRGKMSEKGAGALVVTKLDDVACELAEP